MRKWIVIVDYNLTRVDDVKLLLEHAKSEHGLSSILIRKNPNDVDRALANHVIDLGPLEEGFLEKAVAALEPFSDSISAVLPFSDDGVWKGAELAEALGVRVDNPQRAEAAFSKSVYRQWETSQREELSDSGMQVPKYEVIHSLADLASFSRKCPFGFVLKPSCEGNNRGVVRLLPGDSLLEAFEEVEEYLSGGLVAEELITLPEEYSFDGVGDLNFVTQKLSETGRYPVEHGQIVPARLSEEASRSIHFAGKAANEIVGQSFGPFHNEIKYCPTTHKSAVIEPNRRPAGMKIWHLAERVYGVNLFKLWVDEAVSPSKRLPELKPRGIAAIRQLKAPCAGTLKGSLRQGSEGAIFLSVLSHLKDKTGTDISEVEWFDFQISSKPGEAVHSPPKDNSQFLGTVSLFSKNKQLDVESVLEAFESSWSEVIREYIEEDGNENLSFASNSLS